MPRFLIPKDGGYEAVSEEEFSKYQLKKIGDPKDRQSGLGDAVAAFANPIARISDSVFGTKLVGCGGCAKRKAALNALMPDISKPIG